MHYLGQLPDLPLPHTNAPRLRTRRKALAQIVLCKGCCCGQTERGLPAVPLDWLKPIWKSEKLNKFVQLTVSGCLGPCDLPNVCCVVTPQEQAWYGRLTTQEDYTVLLNWARQCRERNELLPLPTELEHLRFERWPGDDDTEPFAPIAQEPGDVILLTAADTEVLTWSAAAAQLPAGFASVRALNIDRLRDRRVFDAYLDDVLQECRVLLVRVLGGLGYWREPLEQLHLLARAHRIALVCLPGDAQPDPDLARLCTVPLTVADMAFRYCIEGGVANAGALLHFLSDTLLGTARGCDPPRPMPQVGIYHPDHASLPDLDAWRRQCRTDGRPTISIVFYRAHWVTGNLAPIDALVRALEQRGANVLALFGPQLHAILESGVLAPGLMDVLIATTSFSTALPAQRNGRSIGLGDLDIPVLQAIFCSSSENVWAANIAGLSPRDVAMNVALPEFDGRIITTAVSFKNTVSHDPFLQTDVVRYQPRMDRVEHVAELACNWARLRSAPNRDKRIAILLANYPSKNARVGNAVGLDTPASLHTLLLALRDAGYDTGPALPADGQALIEALIAVSLEDAEFATAPHDVCTASMTAEQYGSELLRLPSATRDGIAARWGSVEQSPQFSRGALHVGGLRFGNIFIGIQPSRGYDRDPAAVYHSPDLAPTPYYFAFYNALRNNFGAHAVIHLGKHGNLEWLPGKSAALSAACYPEAVLGALPNVYPYIINNPGEGTQAKRRSAAVIVDHLIPPMTRADTYGDLRRLENLLDEYYSVQSLDPSKAPLVLREIGVLVETTALYRDFECDRPPSDDELPKFLGRVDGYLCEIKEAQIRDGLHRLGRLPEGEQLIDLLLSLVRLDNGDVLGLAKALATDQGLSYADLTRDLAARVGSVVRTSLPVDLVRTADPTIGFRTCGDVLEALNGQARQLVRQGLESGVLEYAVSFTPAQTTRTLQYLWHTLLPRLRLCSQEIDHVLAALEGRFVPPGPSGAPTRGTADVLPTGRNFYSLDIRALPTPTAWRVGCAAADALLERHRERTGAYPESVALVIWGTSNMRTGGDDIAEVFALLGVRPVWDEANRRVLGVEAIPLIELGRPRIDVTVRISGLFRDAFPNLVQLLNDAVNLVARLVEPLDRNFVKAHIARDTAMLCRGADALPVEEASRRAGLRVFGSKPGAYGAGLLPLIDGRNWQTTEDLAGVYLTWSSYAYTGGEQDGSAEPDAFRLRLTQTEVVAQNQDNREHDIFDSDDYFQFHGGLIASVRALTGRSPAAYLGDSSQPDQVKARTLQEEAYRVFRSRVVNPRWLAGVMRHGYKGAVEMAATIDYLFGYDATAEVLDDWMYERLAEAYLFDEPVRDFVRRNNPWAERAMIERLLEAVERGLWEHPEGETLERLRDQHGANDAWLEGEPPRMAE
ncbi:MAG: cobaltochelatase subunit CobN [Gemmataceae bacterium]|nr:cobaltochelatase subunit CobN [Gemmataceae bacterium]